MFLVYCSAMHVYEYRRIVVPSKHWTILTVSFEESSRLYLGHGYWMRDGEMVVGYAMGNVFRHVYQYNGAVHKQVVLSELVRAVPHFYQRLFRKRCARLCLPLELCVLVATFLA